MTDEPPAAAPGQGDNPPTVARRRLQSANAQDTKGRGGCLATGALLGIIIGVMFALYGLGPILRYFYGEEKIEAGQAYIDGDRRLQVTGTRIGPDSADGGLNVPVIFVTVERAGFPANEPRPARFRLEVDGVEAWILPLPQIASAELPDPAATVILLRYSIPSGLDPSTVTPVALHLEDPLVRFALGDIDRLYR